MTGDDNIREVVGTTVAVSAKTRGVEWVDRECYFLAAPQAEDLGMFCRSRLRLSTLLNGLSATTASKRQASQKMLFTAAPLTCGAQR